MTWKTLLKEELSAPYYHELQEKVTAARKVSQIYPSEDRTFFALEATPPEKVRAVILGQDPYHEPGQARGLAFSGREGAARPPSIRNIFKELEADVGIRPSSGDLTPWARQGVLLLNTVLTVERGKANSHASWGWQRFTDGVLRATNQLPQPIAFVLWGGQAQKKEVLISADAPRLILKAPHPSPLSSYRGFFGSRPFSRINAFLPEPIDWSL